MGFSTGSTQLHRVDLTVVGHGILTAMLFMLIVAGLVAAHERLAPHFEAGGEDISIPANLV